MKKPLKWIISTSKFMRAPIMLLMILCTLISICSVSFAILSGEVINTITSASGESVLKPALLLGGVIIVEIILRVLNSRLSVSFGSRLEMRFREIVFESLSGKKWIELNKFHSGELVNRIRNDSNVITDGIMHILPNGIMFLTRVVLAVIALFSIDPLFTVILCLASLLLVGFGRIYSKKMKFFHKAVQESEGKNLSYMLETLQNIIVLKAFGKEKRAAKTLRGLHKETINLRLKRNTWNIAANVSMIILFTGGYAFTVLWGAFNLSRGLMFGDFTAMIQLIHQVQSPFKSMGSLLVKYQNMIASAERILELLSLGDDFDKKSGEDSFAQFDSIVFDSVTFSYGEEKVLDNASMEIKKGEFVALCGISGSGKSTIIRLLLNLIDPSLGKVFLKGDVDYPIDATMRNLFGYVPQGNMLISGTIADNISYYSHFSKEDIESAARKAQLDFALSLPQGLDTLLGEKGSGLSEGQIQRIAVARALVRNSPVLLLDEATSALDEDTEMKLLEALKEDKDKTVIIITHRKKVLDYCDKIITLSDGKLEVTQ